MHTLTLLLPILPGKQEAWRRMLQDICEVHHESYRAWRTSVGFTDEQVWLLPLAHSGAAVVTCSSEHPAEQLRWRAAQPHPFQGWLCHRVLEVHGIDLNYLEMDSQAPLLGYGGCLPESC
jgi:hypothetical protein